MKKFLLLIFFCLSVLAVNAQKTYVLAVGVSNYPGSQSDLHQTTKDVKAFADLMKAHTPNVSILTSSYATHDNTLAKLRAICAKATANDKVIFYYSGHGSQGSICTYDKSTTYNELISILGTCRASAIYVFVDACFSGTVTFANGTLKSNMAFFMSSRRDETSIENPTIGAGEFSQSMMKGLRGKSDSNLDKKITVLELFTYIHKDMKNRGIYHHPQLIAKKDMYNKVIIRW